MAGGLAFYSSLRGAVAGRAPAIGSRSRSSGELAAQVGGLRGERLDGCDRLSDVATRSLGFFTESGRPQSGASVYDALRAELGDKVLGMDRSEGRVAAHRETGRNVILGDSTDPDLHERFRSRAQVRLALLTMSNHQEKLAIFSLLRHGGFAGTLAALAVHEDEVAELREAGVPSRPTPARSDGSAGAVAATLGRSSPAAAPRPTR